MWEVASGQVRATLTGHEGWVLGVAFSPGGELAATVSIDGTARIWTARTGKWLATLLHLEDDAYGVLLPDGSYKLHGDSGGALWWAVKLCRFELGELDEYVPTIRRLPDDAVILPSDP